MKRGFYTLILLALLVGCSPKNIQKQALFIAELGHDSTDKLLTNIESIIAFFDVELLDGFIEISWQTNSEDSIYLFEIEKAIGGDDYELLAKIEPFGNHNGANYVEIDNAVNYNESLKYRLKITKRNSQIYSDSIQIFIENPVSDIDILVHPTQKKQYLQFNGLTESNGEMNLYHADGSLANSQNINIHKGNNEIEIPLQNQLGGVYYLQFKAPQKNWITRILNLNIPI